MSISNPAPHTLCYVYGDEPIETKPTVVRWNNHELSQTETGYCLTPTTGPVGKTSFEKILPGCPCPYPAGAEKEPADCGHPQRVVALPDGWQLDIRFDSDRYLGRRQGEKQLLLTRAYDMVEVMQHMAI